MIVLVIIIYIIIGMLEITPMIKKKQKKELVLYSVLYGTAFIVSILISMDVKIPSPAKPIEKIVQAIVKNL